MKFIEELTFDFIEFLPFNKRPFKARLIPAQIWIDLDSYKDNIYGLRDYCKKWKTKVQFIVEPDIHISGEYDSVDNQCTLYIFSPKFPHLKFCRDTITWQEFKYDFIQTLLHEMIHVMQYSNKDDNGNTIVYSYRLSGNKEIDDEREYYSEQGEIQAYAHCIFLDYKTHYNEPIIKLLSRCTFTRESYTFSGILNMFGNKFADNYALHKLVKEVLRWEARYKMK